MDGVAHINNREYYVASIFLKSPFLALVRKDFWVIVNFESHPSDSSCSRTRSLARSTCPRRELCLKWMIKPFISFFIQFIVTFVFQLRFCIS